MPLTGTNWAAIGDGHGTVGWGCHERDCVRRVAQRLRSLIPDRHIVADRPPPVAPACRPTGPMRNTQLALCWSRGGDESAR